MGRKKLKPSDFKEKYSIRLDKHDTDHLDTIHMKLNTAIRTVIDRDREFKNKCVKCRYKNK